MDEANVCQNVTGGAGSMSGQREIFIENLSVSQMGHEHSHHNCTTKNKSSIIHGYHIGRMIARTENSSNFEGTDTYNENRSVVLKFIDTYSTEMESVATEFELMRNMRHENVIEFIDMFSLDGCQCLVTPYARSGTLLDHFDPEEGVIKNEAVVKSIMWQILRGLAYIHSRNVIHRDIKLNNIYIKNDDVHHPEIEIADFGCAAAYDASFDNAFVGTPVFVAPEIYQGIPYDFKADVWSVGIVMFALLTGGSPFPSVDDDVMKWMVLNRDIPYKDSIFSNYSSNCMNLLKSLLIKDPIRRISTANALNHPWFDDIRK